MAYKVVISTDNGTSCNTAANVTHLQIFLDKAMDEKNHGRVVLIIEEK